MESTPAAAPAVDPRLTMAELIDQLVGGGGNEESDSDELIPPVPAPRRVMLRATGLGVRLRHAGRARRMPPARAARPAPRPLSEPEGRLVLPDDPLAAVATNDAHRRANVPDGAGSDLWPLEGLAARPYAHTAPTFAPPGWRPRPLPSQAEYSRRFAAEFPEVASILPIDNVVVAGGAAAWPLNAPDTPTGDVDLFIHGIDPQNRAALWAKLDEVARALAAAFEAGPLDFIAQELTPGVLTFFIDGGGRERRVQVVLRAYGSASAVLHGFDVPSCCVAYDGATAYTTTLGAFAQLFRVNVVWPAYRSPTYEARLAKYFGRGYALALPHLAAFGAGDRRLPRLTLAADRASPLFAVGALAAAPGGPSLAASSDYGPTEYDAGRFENEADWRNLHEVSSGRGRFLVTAVKDGGNDEQRLLDFSAFEGDGPALPNLLLRADVEALLDRAQRGAVSALGGLNLPNLHRCFGLVPEEVGRLATAVARAQDGRARPLDLGPALRPAREAILRRYDAFPTAIAWWTSADPERQFTGSVRPCAEEPADWYGPHYAPPQPASSEDLEAARALSASNHAAVATAHNTSCPFCLEEFVPGEANTLTLPCGHALHWSKSPSCGGFRSWEKGEKTGCPMCRGSTSALPRRGRAAPTPVQVLW